MWRAFCLKFLLGEQYTVSFIERLKGAPRLREICGFDESVASEATFSRFFNRLADYPELLDIVMAAVVERLRAHLPDIGRQVAVDSTDIEAWCNPRRSVIRDPDAAWGVRTAKNKSKDKKKGKVEKEPFFGYNAHLICDAVYGVPLSFTLLSANENDSPQLPTLVEKAQESHTWLKPEYLLADRGYDAQSNHWFLYHRSITPIIHVRKPTAEDKLYDGIYDKSGAPVCDGKTPMEYVLTDPNTGYHQFRCPPDGCELKKRSRGVFRYCDTVEHWEDPKNNLRAIGVVARASPEWADLYARRPVIERHFRSAKHSRLMNQHQYRGMRKVEMHVKMSVLTYVMTMLGRMEADGFKALRHMRVKTE